MKWTIPAAEGFQPSRYIRFLLILALILVALMAIKSSFNRHPDEINHFLAAQYYRTHFLPPVIEDPAIRESYSAYGVSYLNYHWIEYVFAGKFAYVVSLLNVDVLASVRFSSVFLFASLAIFFIYRSKDGLEHLIIPGFLLTTPQVWYVFSYINNDAFALFVSVIVAFQIAHKESFLNHFLRSEGFFPKLHKGIIFGLLLGFLLIAKANYFPFLIFAACWLAYGFPVLRIAFGKNDHAFKIDFDLLKKFAFMALVALSVLTFRCGLDFYVNGETNFVGFSYLNKYVGNLENEGRLLAFQEEVADYCCKPSTVENDLPNSHKDLHLKEKGLSLKHLFSRLEWHKFSFASFVGGYGYMDIWASKNFYRFFAILYILFGFYLIAAIVRSGVIESIVQLGITLFASFLTVFISVYLSWTYAFQPQGRYLFPIIGMIGVFVYSNRRYLHNTVLNNFVVCSFLLSAYSFIFVALRQID